MAGTSMLSHALDYASRGWPVFPCDPRSKRPLVEPDKDPATGETIKGSGGLHKASTVEATIRAWWKRWPKAMIGVPMGARVGAFAIDLDLGDPALVAGDDYLEQFIEHVGGIPETAISETASGGIHLLFAWDNARPVHNNGKRLVPALTIAPAADAGANAKGAGVDCRGEGGYIIVPPSVRSDGKAYKWRLNPWSGVAPGTERIYDVVTGREAAAEAKQRDHGPAAQARPASSPAPALGDAPGDLAVRRYALAALESALRDLRNAVAGERNNAINTTAYSLGQLVGAGALRESVARGELQAVVAAWPNSPKSEETIERGLAAGMAQPRDLREVRDKAEHRAAAPARHVAPPPAGPEDYEFLPPDQEGPAPGAGSNTAGREDAQFAPAAEGGGGSDRPLGKPDRRRRRKQGPPGGEAVDLQCAFLPLTDLGNGERFAARGDGKLNWCPSLGWIFWDAHRWSRRGAAEQSIVHIHETVRAIRDEATALRASGKDSVVGQKTSGKGKDERTVDVYHSDVLEAWARTSEGNSRRAKMAEDGGPYLIVHVDQLDADPFKINMANGTLSINLAKRGRDRIEFGEPNPDDLITKISRVGYDPAARCPVFEKFLAQVQPAADTRRFLRAWFGLSLTGDAREQKLAIFWGKGQNGKSTLMEICAHIAGDYATTIPIETFLDQGKGRGAGQATPDLAKLPGVRLLRTSEPDKGAKLAEAFIKAVTGGEPVMARELHKPFFEFLPQFKLTVSGNYRPTISGTDKGIWRRVVLVPWTVTIGEAEKDPLLGDKLRAEAAGILNWMLEGLCDWLDNGLVLPAEVKAATEQYASDSDPLGRFLADCVEWRDGERVQATAMHQLFSAWAKANGEREWTPNGLGRALKERGFVSLHSNVNWWAGVTLLKRREDYVDKDGFPIMGRRAGDAGDESAPAPDGPEDSEFVA